MKRAAIAVALVASVLGTMMVLRPSNVEAATTFNIRAGDGEQGYTVNAFLPNSVTILKGDTVHYDFKWKEPHTATVGTPAGDPTASSVGGKLTATYDGTGFVSSGLLGDEWPNAPGAPKAGKTFDLTFSKAGEYTVFCAIHPLMTSTVKVLESGTVSKQADLDAAGQSTYTGALAALKTVAAGLNKPAAVTPKAGGGNQYSLVVAGETPSGDVQQYFPPTLNVAEGDTVVWNSSVLTPHTVTFGPPPAGDPFAASQTKPADGKFAGGPASSAIIGVNWPAGQTFELTFTKAGTYDYLCILHFNQGMMGKVVVAAAPATPTPTAATTPAPPKTGSGLADTNDGPRTMWLATAGLAIVLMSLGSLSLMAAHRRR